MGLTERRIATFVYREILLIGSLPETLITPCLFVLEEIARVNPATLTNLNEVLFFE